LFTEFSEAVRAIRLAAARGGGCGKLGLSLLVFAALAFDPLENGWEW